MGFRIVGPAHGQGDREATHPDEDEGMPALHWFLSGLPETDPAGNPTAARSPGSITITLDETSGRYRVTIRERCAGLVAFYTLERLSDLLDEMEEALQSSRFNWQIDKYKRKK